MERIATGFGFTEGPAWSPDGFLVFSDLGSPVGNRVIKLNADGTTEDFLKPSGGANGLLFDRRGNLYICQGGVDASGNRYRCGGMCRRVSKLSRDGELVVLADAFNTRRLNSPNGLAFDGVGGIYFTDPRYFTLENLEQEVMGGYYLAPTGNILRVVSEICVPNGILVSNDGTRLYVADTTEVRQELPAGMEKIHARVISEVAATP